MGKIIDNRWFIFGSSILLSIGYVFASMLLIVKCNWAFLWIFLLTTLLTIILAIIWTHYRLIKIILINLALVSLLVGGIELTLLLSQSAKNSGTTKEGSYYNALNGYKVSNKIFGYRPGVNRSEHAKFSYLDGRVIFDTTYSTNDSGWRIAPKPIINDKAILFFGGSFTYGECLKNDETFAWLAGVATGYKIFNFGFHGYGPHQMLAGIEYGVFDKCIKDCQPKYAIYTAIPDHPERSAGWAFWDTYGPKYTLDSSGRALYSGNFHSVIFSYMVKGFSRSAIFNKLKRAGAVNSRSYNVKLAVAIVSRSKLLLKQKYPEIQFIVLYWGNKDDYYAALKASGVDTVLIEDIIPDYFKNIDKYQVELDHHPNVISAKLVSNFLADKIKQTGTTHPSE